ncbi:ester cyclase [Streptomyces sp. NPDC127033]|uniref:nuclear transport factor 2 family protein n=1 Tax=Streptomyces sp. NPDC127033 TaxID=3347110 RepID=UPI00365F5846
MSTTPRTSLDGFHATKTAQQADELVRAFVAAVSAQDNAALDTILARNFLSYAIDGVRSRTALKKYYTGLHQSFSDLRFEVHENVGVLVENDLIALRTVVTGTHTGDYAGVPATGKPIQTSVSHIFRFRDDRLVEHWQVMDTYRILVKIGRLPGVAAQFQQLLGVPESPEGIFVEKPGTEFDASRKGRPVTRDESRAVSRRLYDGAITTGVAEDVDALAEAYIQNTGWTPDGRSYFGNAWAIGRGAMADGLAVHIHVVAENDRVASISLWDGTITAAGTPVDFASADFLRVEDGVAAEHWDTVDYVRLYQSFGLLPQDS